MSATECTISRKDETKGRKQPKKKKKSAMYWHLRSAHPPFSMLSAGLEDDVWVLGIR